MVMDLYQRGDPHPECLAALADIARLGDPDLAAMTPAEARASRDLRFADSTPTPVFGIEELTIAAVPTRIYRATAGIAPALVWLHGGGWILGGWATHDEIFRLLAARTGSHVIAPEYRLAPEHPFPAGLDDCIAVIRAVTESSSRYDVEPGPTSVGGDSAGGNLALVAALSRPDLVLGRLALVYPITDCRFGTASYREDSTHSYLRPEWMMWFRDHYLTSADQTDDWRVSPVLAPTATLAELGETLVMVASHDPLRDEGLAFADRLGRAGGRVDTLIAEGFSHGFLGFAGRSPIASAYLDAVVTFLAE